METSTQVKSSKLAMLSRSYIAKNKRIHKKCTSYANCGYTKINNKLSSIIVNNNKKAIIKYQLASYTHSDCTRRTDQEIIIQKKQISIQ